MTEYRYNGIDSKGKRVSGDITATSRYEAHVKLESIGIFPKKIEEVRIPLQKASFRFFTIGRVRTDSLIIFTEQFATMVSSGLPVVDVLQGLSEQEDNRYFAKVIADIREDVSKGASLSTAFGKHRNVFPEIFVNLLSVGELTGRLDTVLKGIATYLERDYDLRKKINSAFAYPKFIVVVVLGVLLFLVNFVLPRFVSMLLAADETLPTPTRVLLSVSSFIKTRWFVIVIVVAGIYFLYRLIYSSKQGHIIIDKAKLSFPIFGKISKYNSLIRFFSAFVLAVESGIDIIDALEGSRKISQNAYVIGEIDRVVSDIKSGRNLSESFSQRRVFPKVVVQMTSAGEKSGSLDIMLEKLIELWEKNLDYIIKVLAARIEPTLVVILGVIVGFVALAMYLPMFSLPGALKRIL